MNRPRDRKLELKTLDQDTIDAIYFLAFREKNHEKKRKGKNKHK